MGPSREGGGPARLYCTFTIDARGERVEMVDDEVAVEEYRSLTANLEAAQRCAVVSNSAHLYCSLRLGGLTIM